MDKRKICVVTGTRADYGLLYWLLKEIDNDENLELQLVATAMHLSPEFGLTYKTIEEDGFEITDNVELLLSSDSEIAVSKAIGLGCISFAETFQKLNPDMVLVLGDRFEIFSAASAAMIMKIPLVHLHGGETTQGAIDEALRHSITKMATYHFPATEKYKKRIIQMGEQSERVFNFGMAGLDNIYKLDLLSKKELESSLDFKLDHKTALVTYHPVTLDDNSIEEDINNLLLALDQFELNIIFTKSNADTGGRIINQKIAEYVEMNSDKSIFVDSLGQLRYLSALKHFDLMIGNSSSGITEAPSFKLPVVNIGDRQKGRVKAKNIIDTNNSFSEITKSIKEALSTEFKQQLSNLINPYDKYQDGKTSEKIKNKLKAIPLNNNILKKEFKDIDF